MVLLHRALMVVAILLDIAVIPGVAAKVPLRINVDIVLAAKVLARHAASDEAVLAVLLEGGAPFLAATRDVDPPGVVVDGSLAWATATLRVAAREEGSAGASSLNGRRGGRQSEGRGGEDGQPEWLVW